MICFVAAGVSVLSPELNVAHRMMSALPPFVPSSSQRVTNEQCIKDSQLYLQELRSLALWALKSEYLLTFKGLMLDISNAACTPQWPNVIYI